jgi:hypothetical protein
VASSALPRRKGGMPEKAGTVATKRRCCSPSARKRSTSRARRGSWTTVTWSARQVLVEVARRGAPIGVEEHLVAVGEQAPLQQVAGVGRARR